MYKKCLLIDTYSVIFRAFFVYQKNSGSTEDRGNGWYYGQASASSFEHLFVSMICKLIRTIEPSHIAAVFDGGGKNFRHELSPSYKSHRPPMPEELVAKMPKIRSIIDAMSIKILERKSTEADDIIASLVKQNTFFDSMIIASPDKDLLQLMSKDVIIFDPLKSKYISDLDVIEKFGVSFDKIRDVLALIGDRADNIEGVPGIGPKTAAKLLNEFNDIANLINNLQSLQSKRHRDLIEKHIDALRLSWELVGLNEDIIFDESMDELHWKPELSMLESSFKEHGIYDLVARIKNINAKLVSVS